MTLPRLFSASIFILIIASIYFGMHAVIYRCLKQWLATSASSQRLLFWTFWGLGISFFLQILFNRILNIQFFSYLAYPWMGIIASAFFIFLLQWLLALLFPNYGRTLAWAALAVTVILCGYSLILGSQDPVVRRFAIPLKNLPPQLAGCKIVQLSDLHLVDSISEGRIARIVGQVNSLKPDLVVITGDLIDGPMIRDGHISGTLKRLQAAWGTLAVTGNHDYYAGISYFNLVTEGAGIRVLRDELVVLGNGLHVGGVDDGAGRRAGESNDMALDCLLQKRDSHLPFILLCHRPSSFDAAADKGVDFQLSGHTHNGQFFPGCFLVKLLFRYPFGLYQNRDSWLYTSCGTGWWGPAMRFLSRNEIVQFTLVPKSASSNGS
jgi:predicted MPP superfamily phosphohydrolase